MRRRTVAPLVLAALASACGAGSPLAPLQASALTLSPGPYQLRIFTQVARQSSGMSTWVCLTIGGTSAVQPGMSIALPVDVEQAAGFWAVRTPAGTLAMRLDAQGGSLSGTVEGEATSGDRTVVIGTSRQHLSPALVSASAGPTAFTGDIAGDVAFIDGAVTHSCSSNGWSLTPR